MNDHKDANHLRRLVVSFVAKRTLLEFGALFSAGLQGKVAKGWPFVNVGPEWRKSMKMILSIKSWIAICLFAVSTAGFASVSTPKESVWAPTENQAFFFATNFLNQTVLTGTFGIFDDTADISLGNAVVQFTGFDWIKFAKNGSNYDVTASVAGFTKRPFSQGQLTASNHFKVGYLSDSGWTGASANSDEVPGYIYFGFPTGTTLNNIKLLVAEGIAAVNTDDPISAVPLPASVWLMTSAVLGLLYLGRGKSHVTA